ncbi:MAG: DUF971 domain-containing protein [Candidatus Poribacteria bacterium]|nr:DUF971 domain-containing protein [Candidatus Poribacteria bacterium]
MSSALSVQQKQPKTLKKLGNTGFHIVWKDEHESEYTYPHLRRLCPCAECSMTRHSGRDVHSLFGPEGVGEVSLIAVPDDIRALDIELVGRYAIQFTWSDGHSTGIYSFETLREICPCPECTA